MPSDNALKICLVCSEYTPLAKTGGLADVTAALSEYFGSEGHDTLVLLPYYASLDVTGLRIKKVAGLQGLQMTLGDRTVGYSIVKASPKAGGADIHLLQCDELYGGPELYSGPEEHLRFILLSRAAIEMCQKLKFAPDIFHCHDWHTALVPIYLKAVYSWDQLFKGTRSVLTIHNIGYQGVFGAGVLKDAGLKDSAGMLDADFDPLG